MNLTLEADHPIAQAIRSACEGDPASDVTLSLNCTDGKGNWHRTLNLRLHHWTLRRTGRHSVDPDMAFECELIDVDNELRYIEQLTSQARRALTA